MRTDRTQATDTFRKSSEWAQDPFTQQQRPDIDSRYVKGTEDSDRTRWHSFSGHERNSFFLNQNGTNFENASALSGLDNIADSRVWVRWDFDHDGAVDIAMVNADFPLLNVYRNKIAELPQPSIAHSASSQHFIAIRLHGAHHSSQPAMNLSNRDGIGARIRLTCGPRSILRVHNCGEGFAAQNSGTELIGLGTAHQIDMLEILWPSGRTTQLANVATDQLIEAFEASETAPHGEHFEQLTYKPRQRSQQRVTTTIEYGDGRELPIAIKLDVARLLGNTALADSTDLLCFTTTATWCEACHRLQPRLKATRDRTGNHVQFFGVPVDSLETPAELSAFATESQPAYALLTHLDDVGRQQVTQAIERLLNTQSLPCTLVTDRAGNVLSAYLSVPDTSELGRLRQSYLISTR